VRLNVNEGAPWPEGPPPRQHRNERTNGLMGHESASVLIISSDPASNDELENTLRRVGELSFPNLILTVIAAGSLESQLSRLPVSSPDILLLTDRLSSVQSYKDVRLLQDAMKSSRRTLVLQLLHQSDADRATYIVLQRGAFRNVIRDYCDAEWLPEFLLRAVATRLLLESIARAEKHYTDVIEASAISTMLIDTHGSCICCNTAYQKLSGQSLDQALDSGWTSIIHPLDRARTLAAMGAFSARNEYFRTKLRFQSFDGQVSWMFLDRTPIVDADGIGVFIQTVQDLGSLGGSELTRHVTQAPWLADKAGAHVALNLVNEAVLSSDCSGKVTFINPLAEKITGWARQTAIGEPAERVLNLVDGVSRVSTPGPVRRVIEGDHSFPVTACLILIRPDGNEISIEYSAAPILDRNQQLSGAVVVFHDISHSESVTLEMAHLAHHDFLTDLPNRALLVERMTQAIASAGRRKKRLAILYIDLDHFKKVNDSLGHAAGDKVLRLAASKLGECIRETDTLARQGGDEFVLLLTDVEQHEDIARIASKLALSFSSGFTVEGHLLHLTMSIGVGIYPQDGTDTESLLGRADHALYQAKEQGRNCLVCAQPDVPLTSDSCVVTPLSQ